MALVRRLLGEPSRPRRLPAGVRSSVALVALLGAWGFGAQAQDLVTAARPSVTSQEELIARLQETVRPTDDYTERTVHLVQRALIATWGEPIPTWALQIALDEGLHQPLRVAAFHVLGYARPQHAVAALMRVAELGPDTGFTSSMAMEALQSFPYPELAPMWRRVLDHPNVNVTVRIYALNGLSMSGSEDDIPLILSVRGVGAHNRDSAVAKLRLPPEERGRALFAGPPPPDARFVPSDRWLRDARDVLCRVGRCPP